TILGRNLSQQYPPTPIFGTASACGAIFLTIAVALSVGLPDFTHFTLRSAVAILWLGPLGTMGVYLYWIRTLAHAPVAGLALTLFLQPVLGAALSYLLLGERLEPIQILGGALIFSAVFWQAATRRSKKTD
ncbi:MAG: EamA family transporter, partial [Bdellovibrionota bacterium]